MNDEPSVVKVCILLFPDTQTSDVLEGISDKMSEKYPNLFTGGIKAGGLPYHMTMIGGIELPLSECESVIRDTVAQLKPFRGNKWLPKTIRVEPRQSNGNMLTVRFVFKPKSYLLTGNPVKTARLVSMLAPEFNLDADRHITLGQVGDGFQGMGTVFGKFAELVKSSAKSLSRVTFTPQVWVKTDEVWSQYKLD